MREVLAHWMLSLIAEISLLDSEIILLAILVVIGVIVIDSLSSFAHEKRQSTGTTKREQAISIDGTKEFPSKQYISDIQGLAGRPDAIIKENGFLIPVERKPLAKKLHDRYVAQILVYMRLIEEFEGKRPPYGYLILGPKCRKVRIENSEQRQQWLQKHIDQMRNILEHQVPAIAAPHERKCARCEVRHICQHALSAQQGAYVVNNKSIGLTSINKRESSRN
jgi:CRISPR-associated exonuclease Cas4